MQRQPIIGDTACCEVLRYRKGVRRRRYVLREVNGCAELWVQAQERACATRVRRLVIFTGNDDIAPFLADVESELRRGEWSAEAAPDHGLPRREKRGA